jgi:aerobic-type carbon monoxide dehydrogenase small subunit (CoxS/CutS family)
MQPPYFQPITQRPVFTLPNHAKVAVWVVMNVEHFTFGKLGTAIHSCIYPAMRIVNQSVTTVEGLSKNGELAPIQQAFLQEQGF